VESITFRCASCATPLRAPADQAGHKVRCKRCGTVLTVPGRTAPEPEARSTASTGLTGAEPPGAKGDDPCETEDQTEIASTKRRKRRRVPVLSADLRSDAGWRKVRLGLILIAVSPLVWLLVGVLGWLLSFERYAGGWASWFYLGQALPLAGNTLCAFVPLKGAARTLALANLGVIALGLALTLVTTWMSQRTLDAWRTRHQQLTMEAAENDKQGQQVIKELGKGEQELREKVKDLRRKAAKGDKEAAAEERELSKKLGELSSQRLAEQQKQLKRSLDLQLKLSRELTADGPGFGERIYSQSSLLLFAIPIIIMSFFIRAIALALGDRTLAGSCPRVAALVLLLLILQLLWTILPPGALAAVQRLWLPILALLGLVGYVWQVLQLIEACTLIGNHLNAKSA
jgi:hypothetical protein